MWQMFSVLCNNSDWTWFFNALTFARSLGKCWKPRPSASVFSTSHGTWRMLMHEKPCLIPIFKLILLRIWLSKQQSGIPSLEQSEILVIFVTWKVAQVSFITHLLLNDMQMSKTFKSQQLCKYLKCFNVVFTTGITEKKLWHFKQIVSP